MFFCRVLIGLKLVAGASVLNPKSNVLLFLPDLNTTIVRVLFYIYLLNNILLVAELFL